MAICQSPDEKTNASGATSSRGRGIAAEASAALAAAGLEPSAEERIRLATIYAGLKPAIDALYDVAEAADARPALLFQARPKLAHRNQKR